MPTWLLTLLATITGFGFIFCIAMCRARRGCGYCRIIYFIVGQAFGGWLFVTGWLNDSDTPFAVGTAILVCLNLWFGIRFLALWLTYKTKQKAKMSTAGEHGDQSVALALAATWVAAVAGVGVFSAADSITGLGPNPGAAAEGGGDADLDIGPDL